MQTEQIYSGTSGLVLPVTRLSYPPEYQGKSRLCYYASLFNSVEINSSFYKLPQAATVNKWAESVPQTFQFTFKFPKAITHNKGLVFTPEDVDDFFRVLTPAQKQNGCVLIQFPPGLQMEHIKQFEQLLVATRNADPQQLWKIAVEFRHTSWYNQIVYDLLTGFNAAIVIHDLPASAPPADEIKADFRYLRFHGPGGRYRGSYTDDLLNQYACLIRRWVNEGKPVYVYFNNTMGDALNNLITLNCLIHVKY